MDSAVCGSQSGFGTETALTMRSGEGREGAQVGAGFE